MKSKKGIISMLIAATVITLSIPKMSANAQELNSTMFNYGEALQKSIMFYEFQRSGKLPEDKRDNWRGDSALKDGSDAGLDLTQGWYDAGDYVKFNLPMSYSASMLSWSVYEDRGSYERSGQLQYILDSIKWADDYFMKCHPEKYVYYYQVGDPGLDHSWWGPAEVMQMKRPSFKVDINNPGSSVCGETAAALASSAIIFKDSDPEYAQKCLKHAKELFEFADEARSDAGYKAADGYYRSSGFYDELSWASTWLYLATSDNAYLEKAESYVPNWPTEQQSSTIAYKWAQCWDDVHYGTQMLLARITNKDIYKESVERNLDYWTTGYNGEHISYTPKGLAWLNQWGSLRYAETTAFLAGIYSDWNGCANEKATKYRSFMEKQVDYALGSTGRSLVVGFGENPPKNVHHRGAQGSWADDKKIPAYSRHILYGALVGGPISTDDNSYEDDINNYVSNEVACDYNAGFVGALAKMYNIYGGNPISNFKSIEEKTNDEFCVEASVNATGSNFIEIKALLYNRSGWPAKVGDQLSFKYFVNLSELYNAGYTVKDVKVNTNYNDGASVSQLLPWDETNHIYYVNADFTGTKIYPGGQSACKKELQFRIAVLNGTNLWDNSNDYSYDGIAKTPGSTPIKTDKISVYDAGNLVYGIEPKGFEQKLIGDVNNDGTINSEDYTLLINYINSGNEIEGVNVINSDLNNDGKINFFDLVKLKQKL